MLGDDDDIMLLFMRTQTCFITMDIILISEASRRGIRKPRFKSQLL